MKREQWRIQLAALQHDLGKSQKRFQLAIGSNSSAAGDWDITVCSMPPIDSMVQLCGRLDRNAHADSLEMLNTVALALPRTTFDNIFTPGLTDLQLLATKVRTTSGTKLRWLQFCFGLRVCYLVIDCIANTVVQFIREMSDETVPQQSTLAG